MITQNIDRLHRMAGTERLVEVHGSIECSVCLQCGGKVHIDRVVELRRAVAATPECLACIAPLKPDVVLFGELLPEAAMAEAHDAGRRGRPDALHRLLAGGLPGGRRCRS